MKLLIFCLIIVGLSVFRAHVLVVLWDIFIVPAFVVPKINMVTAYGISLIVDMITLKYFEYNESGYKLASRLILYDLSKSLISLVAGYAVHFVFIGSSA